MTGRRPLKVGIFLTPWLEGSDASVPRWADVLARAKRSEEVGFDSIWVSDHLLFRFAGEPPRGGWEGWSQVAALAAITKRATIGTLVICANWRNPALLAKMADTVDEISGGRLVLGLGAGWHEPEFTAFGYRFDHRIDRFEEALQIICPLLRQGHVDFAGTYCTARDCELRPRGPRPHGPPIMIGALADGPRLLRLAATHADLWNAWIVWANNYPEATPPLRAAVDAACARVGRDPATLRRTVSVQVDLPGAVPGRNPNERPLRGSADEIAEALRGHTREGIDHIQVLLNPNTLAAIEAFAPVLALLDDTV